VSILGGFHPISGEKNDLFYTKKGLAGGDLVGKEQRESNIFALTLRLDWAPAKTPSWPKKKKKVGMQEKGRGGASKVPRVCSGQGPQIAPEKRGKGAIGRGVRRGGEHLQATRSYRDRIKGKRDGKNTGTVGRGRQNLEKMGHWALGTGPQGAPNKIPKKGSSQQENHPDMRNLFR